MSWNLDSAVAGRREEGLLRTRTAHDGHAGPEMNIDGQPLTAFCSNDYLGLSRDCRVIEAACEAMRQCGAGSGASAMISGYHDLQRQLEQELAAFTGHQACLVFSSGYLCNTGVLDALLGRKDTAYMDRLNHASLLDGVRLSGARLRRYHHLDIAHLGAQLASNPGSGRRLVASDAVFSMDGDLAPLHELRRTCDQQAAWLMVDDAHGFGILGEHGRGTPEQQHLEPEAIQVYTATLGKALGASGGFVCSSEEVIAYLVQFARTQVYSTALPPPVCAAALESLSVLQREPEHRLRLRANIDRFRRGAHTLGLPLLDSATAIQPLLLGDSNLASSVSEKLRRRGLLVPAIRPPTVPDKGARLRITLSAAHSDSQIAQLLDALAESIPRTIEVPA